MKVCTCFLLFTIFAINSVTAKDALQNRKDLKIIQKAVRQLNSKNKNILRYVKENVEKFMTGFQERSVFKKEKLLTLSDFILEAIDILNTYEDVAFGDFFTILDDEIRKYHYRGCKFYEITENPDTRKLLATKLALIKDKPVSVTKAYINALAEVIRNENYDDNIKTIVDYINSLYRHDSQHKFQAVLTYLKYYKEPKFHNDNKLVKIVKRAARSIIFDHYTNLNTNAKRELKDRLQIFWNQFKDNGKPKETSKVRFIVYSSSAPSIDNVTVSTTREVQKFRELHNPIVSDVKPSEPVHFLWSGESGEDLKTETNSNEDSEDEEKGFLSIDFGANLRIKKPPDNTDEVGSGESIGTSSNSIEMFQERQREFNTQRYMTLYTEAIEVDTRKTTKKTNILPRLKHEKRVTPDEQSMWVEDAIGGLLKEKSAKTTTNKYKSSDESAVWSQEQPIEKPQTHTKKKIVKLNNKQYDMSSTDDTSSDGSFAFKQKRNDDEWRPVARYLKDKIKSQRNKVVTSTAVTKTLEPVRMNRVDEYLSKPDIPSSYLAKQTGQPKLRLRPNKLIGPIIENNNDILQFTVPDRKFQSNPFRDIWQGRLPAKRSNRPQGLKKSTNYHKSLRRSLGNDSVNDYVMTKINNLEKELIELKKINPFKQLIDFANATNTTIKQVDINVESRDDDNHGINDNDKLANTVNNSNNATESIENITKATTAAVSPKTGSDVSNATSKDISPNLLNVVKFNTDNTVLENLNKTEGNATETENKHVIVNSTRDDNVHTEMTSRTTTQSTRISRINPFYWTAAPDDNYEMAFDPFDHITEGFGM